MSRPPIGFTRTYLQERLIADVTESILEEMKRLGLQKVDLATKLGVTRPSITQALSGRNLSLRTIADLGWALDCNVYVSVMPRAFPEDPSAYIQSSLSVEGGLAVGSTGTGSSEMTVPLMAPSRNVLTGRALA